VVGILGGSQGADALNRSAGELVGAGYQVLHLAGRDQHERWTGLAADIDDWTVLPFEAEMRFFYAAVDLVVARAGALTVSELAATGTPSILVPYPGAASHQDANAAYLAETGGAVVLPQTELSRLGAEVAAAMEPAELTRRRAAALARGRPDAAGYIAAQLQEAANG
jgi:UDP-N-acetylglucosamine--N-acetylmuramyl-(pentapeptide) pyrophosphoryl-undecaprenol N-acetylglucosamine transferase